MTSLENKRSENQQMRVSIGGFDKKKKKWRINNLESHIFNDIQAEHESIFAKNYHFN